MRRMTNFFPAAAATGALVLTCSAAMAQSPRTENTLQLDDPDSRPPATLADVAWLAGSWTGDAFGGTFEAVWNGPSADSMVGLFKLMNGDDVRFYEILLLIEEEGSLSLKVKHFHADFTAWEEKDDYVRFRFIRADDDALHFSGISFYRISDEEMHVFLALRNGEKVWEEKLVYQRR